MVKPGGRDRLIQVVVSPRFEVFYALQTLASATGEHLGTWRREMARELPARLLASLADVAPSPLIWPLLADALRDSPPAATFPEMLSELRSLETHSFQTFVLGGVFKLPGAVDELIEGNTTLARTIAAEVKMQEKLLSMFGLHPYVRQAPGVAAFERIVAEPDAFRDAVVNLLASFWNAGFAGTWSRIEPQLRESARDLERAASLSRFTAFARERKLPLTIEGDEIRSTTSSRRLSAKSSSTVYLLPSAFNTSRFWAAYVDTRGRTRFFVPVLDPGITPSAGAIVDSSLVFRALGDTTRYAMASAIARTPMTSVELARAFGVSKPTISHHVQVMRAAALLEETQSERGVVLSLDRRVLEGASNAAAREMFSGDHTANVIRRSRKANRQ